MKRNQIYFFWAIVLGFVVFYAIGPKMCRAQFMGMTPPQIGHAAPDFQLKNLAGQEMTLSDYRGENRAILFFWATWCPHCRTALKDVNARRGEIEARGVKLAAIDVGEAPQVVRTYFERHQIQLDSFLDEQQDYAPEYGVVGLPTFVFIDEGGVIRNVQHQLPKEWERMF